MDGVKEQQEPGAENPPAGAFRWAVREELSTGVCEYSLFLPNGFDSTALATAHVERDGGDVQEDLAFRTKLYFLIGAGIVKAGQIEDSMKRLLILTSGNRHADFSAEGATWTALHKELKLRANRDGPPGNTVSVAVQWAEHHHVKKIRDDLIHANWWDFSGIGVRRTRFAIKSKGVTLLGSLDELKCDVEVLGQYELMLDDCVGPHWPRVYLPATKVQS